MAGPAGTPYHDGLFFFDIKLPPGYPATPPQARCPF
jgi:ubiquitin-conjugating enzyme E2 O